MVCLLSGGNVINTFKAVSSLLGKQSTYLFGIADCVYIVNS
jgi:hypothetical protein